MVCFKINGEPVEFELVNEGDALCLMANGFYVLSFRSTGRATVYATGAEPVGLDSDGNGRLVLTPVGVED